MGGGSWRASRPGLRLLRTRWFRGHSSPGRRFYHVPTWASPQFPSPWQTPPLPAVFPELPKVTPCTLPAFLPGLVRVEQPSLRQGSRRSPQSHGGVRGLRRMVADAHRRTVLNCWPSPDQYKLFAKETSILKDSIMLYLSLYII